jgi:hypothetical protein
MKFLIPVIATIRPAAVAAVRERAEREHRSFSGHVTVLLAKALDDLTPEGAR